MPNVSPFFWKNLAMPRPKSDQWCRWATKLKTEINQYTSCIDGQRYAMFELKVSKNW